MRNILTTPRFERRLASFISHHPELEDVVERAIQNIARDNAASLRVHALKGILAGCKAARISYEYRIVFLLKPKKVYFIDIGTHDDVYR